MSRSTFFVQECPVCGRRLEIRVDYLGKNVVCQHCRAPFVASDQLDGSGGSIAAQPAESLLSRAERLLELAATQRPQLG